MNKLRPRRRSSVGSGDASATSLGRSFRDLEPGNNLVKRHYPCWNSLVPHWIQLKRRWPASALAALMAILLLLLGVLAANDQIHARLHADSPASHGSCSVCALAKGQVDVPTVLRSISVLPVSLVWTIPVLESTAPQTIDFSVASSRGPPDSISSL